MHLLFKKIIVADNEKILLYKNQHLIDILSTGVYYFKDWKREYRTKSLSMENWSILHPEPDTLLAHESFCARVIPYSMLHEQTGLVYINNRLCDIIPSGKRALVWKDRNDVSIETLDSRTHYALENKLLQEILQAGLQQHILYITIPAHVTGLLYQDGKFVKTLIPGQYGFWNATQNIQVKQYSQLLQQLDISGQEILSKDRVSLRINLYASYKLADPVKLDTQLEQAESAPFIYKSLQLALRETVGSRSLDDLLNNKNHVSQAIFEQSHELLAELGMVLLQVGIRDIILPGDMKVILNQVVEAQKAAEANMIKRREETAATRSLHNTAKVMEGNPVLLRLKELETLEKVVANVGNLNVYGGLEGVMKNLVQLNH